MKAVELREKTGEELQQLRDETATALCNARARKNIGDSEQPMQIRTLRRDLARINTVMTEQETGE